MTPAQWRKLGLHVERTRRPKSRGTVYRLFRADACIGTTWSRAELDALLEGRDAPTESAPVPVTNNPGGLTNDRNTF